MCCQYAEQILEITKNIELNFMNIIYIVNLSYNLSLIAYQYYNLYNEQVFIGPGGENLFPPTFWHNSKIYAKKKIQVVFIFLK